MPSNVISLSGGKDSTAMLLKMLERGENIVDIVFFDTGWEYEQMHGHLDQLEAFIGRKITRLTPRVPFAFWFSEHKVFHRNGDLHRIGLGWPSPSRRWCTKEKIRAIHTYCNALTWQGYDVPIVQCIGFAADELARSEEHYAKNKLAYQDFRYPLIEYGMTEADCLAYCKKRGFHWGGLYNVFSRVSCFCCPLQSEQNLEDTRNIFPDLWRKMLEMEAMLPAGDIGRRYKDCVTLTQYEERFAANADFEARRGVLPGVVIPKKSLELDKGAVSNG